jgi:hypothetical protein
MGKKVKLKKILNDQGGQVFIEFMFLLIAIISLSFILVKSSNNFLAARWEAIVGLVVAPNTVQVR